jgi:[ribosomal protein S5]-alanine N-acetyltransferase
MMRVPPLETERLLIRPLRMDDLDAVYQLLDVELLRADFGSAQVQTRQAREEWLRWTLASYTQLAGLNQPPYGERAVVLKQTLRVIGACGYVPCLAPFGLLPAFDPQLAGAVAGFNSPEFGLFYAFSPTYQRQGYATEAAGALIGYAFTHLNLRRIVATTTHANSASIGVMRRLGMRIARNPHTEPDWFQVVGMLENSEPPGSS